MIKSSTDNNQIIIQRMRTNVSIGIYSGPPTKQTNSVWIRLIQLQMIDYLNQLGARLEKKKLVVTRNGVGKPIDLIGVP